MNGLLSLLLIPFFVLGQTLPHSHAGTDVAESSGHALRPHVHLHGHEHSHDDHHKHADESDTTSPWDLLSPTAEHDSDAVYLAASGQLVTRVCGAFGLDFDSTDWGAVSLPIVVDTRSRTGTSDPPDRYATLPIYLLTASLRL
jgi:hypothetical protein